MFLSQILDNLAAIEFRQVYLSADGSLEVDEANRKEMVNLIKVVLLELHSNLLLKTAKIQINVLPDKSTYVLAPEYSTDSSSPFEKYIQGTYRNNLIKILRLLAYDEEKEEYYDLMDSQLNNKYSFRILNYNTIEVPLNYKKDKFFVEYIAGPDPIDTDLAISLPESVWIDLDPALENVLRLGVAAKKFSTTGFPSETNGGFTNYTKLYVNALDDARAKNKGLIHLDYQRHQFNSKGWV